MGTRGTFGIRKNNKDYLMYNHFDSYPEGLGQDVVDFINNSNLELLASKVVGLTVVKEDDEPTKEQAEKYAKFHEDVSTGKDWYSTLRALQGLDFFRAVLHGEVEHIILNNSFIRDSLFCEYGYIINLDSGMLECYEGFQKKRDPNSRYKKLRGTKEWPQKYFPCKMVATFPLNAIPQNWKEIAYKEEAA